MTRRFQRRLVLILMLLATLAPAATSARLMGGGAAAEAVPQPTVLVGAGDIASCDSDGDEATAALLAGIQGTVFTAGDNAYDNGSAKNYAQCYDASWGRVKDRTRPALGNHEYNSDDANPYFDYFGAAAGPRGLGYYSYDLDRYWHVIVLNSNCDHAGGCGVGSTQYDWLRRDIRSHPRMHLIAIWHHPRYNSGNHDDAGAMDPAWDLLYANGGELVISGHAHDYERFAPQDDHDRRDDARGIREFVVGTGGKSHVKFGKTEPNSEVRDSSTWGVLKLSLYPDHYDWQFVPVAGGTFSDSGSAPCHSALGVAR